MMALTASGLKILNNGRCLDSINCYRVYFIRWSCARLIYGTLMENQDFQSPYELASSHIMMCCNSSEDKIQ